MRLFEGGAPLYYQLADELRRRIREGVLAPGESLPRELDISREFHVGQTTVRYALVMLTEEGLIMRRRGLTPMVRPATPRQTVVLKGGSRMVCRMPSVTERLTLGISRGVPLIEVSRADGATDLLVADQVVIVHPDPS